MERISNVQVLRAFAAIIVVVYHVKLNGAHYGRPSELATLIGARGFAGVDLFFVISGFVMVTSQTLRPKSAGTFMMARLRRVVPLYWGFTAAILTLWFVMPGAFRGTLTIEPLYTLASALFVAAPSFGTQPIIYVGWTLEWEMLFYTAFALGLLSQSLKGAIWVAALVMIASVFFTGGQLYGLEFILGMLAGLAYLHGPMPRLGGLALACGAALFALSMVSKSGLDRFFLYGLPSFLIIWGAANAPQWHGRLGLALGNASYAIYLVQVLSIPLIYRACAALPALPADAVALAAIAGTCVIGWGVHVLIERPLTAGLSTWRRAPKPTARHPAHR